MNRGREGARAECANLQVLTIAVVVTPFTTVMLVICALTLSSQFLQSVLDLSAMEQVRLRWRCITTSSFTSPTRY
jgi:hypothetical protein